MLTSGQNLIHQRRNPVTKSIEDLYAHHVQAWNCKGNVRSCCEWVWHRFRDCQATSKHIFVIYTCGVVIHDDEAFESVAADDDCVARTIGLMNHVSSRTTFTSLHVVREDGTVRDVVTDVVRSWVSSIRCWDAVAAPRDRYWVVGRALSRFATCLEAGTIDCLTRIGREWIDVAVYTVTIWNGPTGVEDVYVWNWWQFEFAIIRVELAEWSRNIRSITARCWVRAPYTERENVERTKVILNADVGREASLRGNSDFVRQRVSSTGSISCYNHDCKLAIYRCPGDSVAAYNDTLRVSHWAFDGLWCNRPRTSRFNHFERHLLIASLTTSQVDICYRDGIRIFCTKFDAADDW